MYLDKRSDSLSFSLRHVVYYVVSSRLTTLWSLFSVLDWHKDACETVSKISLITYVLTKYNQTSVYTRINITDLQ